VLACVFIVFYVRAHRFVCLVYLAHKLRRTLLCADNYFGSVDALIKAVRVAHQSGLPQREEVGPYLYYRRTVVVLSLYCRTIVVLSYYRRTIVVFHRHYHRRSPALLSFS
jgi:hypothetical protein